MKKIIVPVDFSATSASALQFAAYLCRGSGLQLSVIFVCNPMIASNLPEKPRERAGQREELERQLEQFARKHIDRIDPDHPLETIVAEGVPPGYLKWLSFKADVALMVLGKVGSGPGDQLDVFGAIARTVSQEGGCPIILIPRNFSDEMMRQTAAIWQGSVLQPGRG